MNFIEDLKWRGLINNVTNEEKINNFCKRKGIAYIGFDPSYDSLHLGNYVMLMVLRRLTNYGHRAIAILGGATGQIGDPSGKSAERNMLDLKKADANAKAIEKQIKKLTKVDVINNLDIYKDMSVFTFLREVGKLINVNYLLEKDIIKSRLTTGISYTEFSYNLIQGYDFSWLYKNKDVHMQIGGSDQWGNITTGIEMIRKLYGDNNDACGITISLLTKPDGTKFGKSENGAVFLDKEYTSPFQMYQFLFNQPDDKIEQLLKFFTMLSKEEIDKLMFEHKTNPSRRVPHNELAKIVVSDVHGEKELSKCLQIKEAFYLGNIESLSKEDLHTALSTAPTFNATDKQYNIIDLLISCGVCASKSQSRTLIESNAIYVNGVLIDKFDTIINKSQAINNQFSYIKKGKKNYFLINWK